MTDRLKYLILLVSCFATLTAQAQLYVQATAYDDAVTLTFFPLDPTAWAQSPTAGYRVERVTLDETGAELPGSIKVVAENAVPKDAAWFEANKAEEEGLMQAIGALLYDTTYQFQDKSLIDPDSMRWNYILYEVMNRPKVGLATGNMVPDLEAKPGLTYRYTVRWKGQPALTASVVLKHLTGTTAQSPEGVELSFRFPENRSLTAMIPRLEQPTFPQVFALAKAYGDSIVVRWAPSSPQMWYSSNQKGYYLIRSFDTEGDTTITGVDTLGLFKPWSKEEAAKWVNNDGSDSLAVLAAGLLYNDNTGVDMGPLTDQASTFETKYGFALFAAEGSQLAAKLLGLGYADKNVRPGKTYDYRVVAVGAPSPFSQGFVTIKNEKTAAVKPFSFTAKPNDLLIELTWEISENVRHFSAYQLERSDDKGKTWARRHESPLTFVTNDDAPLDAFRFRDSVEVNYQEYRYRLRGMDSFGEWGGWAELKSQAIDLTPPPAAELSLTSYNDTTNTATIRWEMTGELPNDFKAFYLLLSEDAETGYDTLAILKKEAREYLWKPDTLLSGNRGYFFRVLAMDIHFNAKPSVEQYMTVPDLIAPPPPPRVAGFIEEDGTVTLVWEHSTAKDVKGYWIYLANDPDNEFTVLNTDLLTENAHTWQVEDVSINPFLYVLVSAQDTHGNKGKHSEMLQLKRPDKVPPATPFLVSAAQKAEGVQIEWKKPDPAEDALGAQLLLRREAGDVNAPWYLLDSVQVGIAKHLDTTCQINQLYQYALLTADLSNNRSDTSNLLEIKVNFLPAAAPVMNLRVRQPEPEAPVVQLTWEFEQPNASQLPGGGYEFLIFRSSGNSNPAFIANVPSGQQDYDDTDVLNGVVYNYAVQAYFPQTGEMGQRSPIKSVQTVGKNPINPNELDRQGDKPAKLVVRGKGIKVSNGSQSPAAENDTDFGRVGTGSTASHKFSIQNNGEVEYKLPDQPVTLEGENLEAWAILQPKTKLRGYGSTEAFTIEFRPKAEGEFTAKVKIAGELPYEYVIKGTGVRKPELDVRGNDLIIQNRDATPTPDDNTDFGGVSTGVKATRIFLLKNAGIDPLQLNGAPMVKGDASFELTNFVMPKNGSLEPGADVSLFITFLPMETGVHNATLTILTNDDDESPFTISIQGVGAGPEVSILGENGVDISNESTTASTGNGTDFGPTTIGQGFSKRFTIKNLGDRTLNLTGRPKISLSGANASDFKLLQEPAPQVKPGGGQEYFTIEFRPKAAGLRQATITVENNDANEGSYQFTIQGTGL